MIRSGRLAATLVLTLSAASSLGCDKVKSMAHLGDGDASSRAGEPGVLGSLFDASFEGEIVAEISSKTDKAPKTVTVAIKSPKLRVDLSALAGGKEDPFLAQGGAVILDPPAKKAFMLMPAKKMAMVLDFEKLKQQQAARPAGARAPGAPSAGSAEDVPKIDKTGKKDVVAGYGCEIWKITSKDGTHAELCMAEGIKLMNFADLAGTSPQLAAVAAFGDLNHFPLRGIAFDAANVETGRMEAKKVEKKKLPDTAFTVPADYQQVDMAQMMAGFAAMAAGAHAQPGMLPGRPNSAPIAPMKQR